MTAIFTDPRAEEVGENGSAELPPTLLITVMLQGFHRIVIFPAGLPLRYSMADINALLAKVDEAPTLPSILPEQPAQSSRGGFWSQNGAGRGRGAPHRRGQPYPPMSSRSSPSGNHYSRTSWTSPGRNHPTSPAVSNGNWRSRDSDDKHQRPDQPNGGQPMHIIAETEGQASQSATQTQRTRQTNSTSNHPAFAPKKVASTGFIDISSDEDK